jgi:hypothetical protein
MKTDKGGGPVLVVFDNHKLEQQAKSDSVGNFMDLCFDNTFNHKDESWLNIFGQAVHHAELEEIVV